MKICFLIQTPSHFPEIYKQYNLHYYGDVYLLTFKQECKKYSEYYKYCHFYPNSRWSDGRNFLIGQSMKTDNYDYTIMMDDDLHIRNEIDSDKTSFELLINFLKEYEPAVCVAKYLSGIQYHSNDKCNTLGSIKDHCFICYHRDAISQLTPYFTKFDNMSWYYNAHIGSILASLLYQNYNLQYNEISVYNTTMSTGTTTLKKTKTAWKVPFRYLKENLKKEYHHLLDQIGMWKIEPVDFIVKKKDIDYAKIRLTDFFNPDCKLVKNNNAYWNECVK